MRQWFESDMEFVCLCDWLNMCAVCIVDLWMRLFIYLISFTLSFFCFNHYERRKYYERTKKNPNFIERPWALPCWLHAHLTIKEENTRKK